MILLNIFEACNGKTPWELVLWLLGAFILGYLLRHFLTKEAASIPKEPVSLAHVPQASHIPIPPKDLETSLASKTSFASETILDGLSSPNKTKRKDDLTKIEGIGPKINELLNQANIYTFEDLAMANYDTLKQILENAGERFRMHNPSTWPNQSKLASEGKWDELKKLQDELKGGRE